MPDDDPTTSPLIGSIDARLDALEAAVADGGGGIGGGRIFVVTCDIDMTVDSPAALFVGKDFSGVVPAGAVLAEAYTSYSVAFDEQTDQPYILGFDGQPMQNPLPAPSSVTNPDVEGGVGLYETYDAIIVTGSRRSYAPADWTPKLQLVDGVDNDNPPLSTVGKMRASLVFIPDVGTVRI